MEEKSKWESVLEIADRGFDFSIKSVLERSWSLYLTQPFAYSGFTIMIFCALLFALVFGQIGQMFANLILLPCFMVGFATFSKALLEGQKQEAGKALFAGFKMMLSFGLIGIALNLLMTAALAPMIIILNQAGLAEMIKTFQETQDPTVLKLDLSLNQQIVILINLLFALYFIVAFMWAGLLTYFAELPFYKAIEGSRRLITSRWWKFFGLLLSLLLIYSLVFFILSLCSSLLGPIFAFLGGIGIFLGLLIVIPLVFISTFLIYDDNLAGITDRQS